MSYTIALDAQGGDHGPSVVVPAALGVLKETPDLKLILVGNRDEVIAELRRHGADVGAQLQICHASQKVEMDDLPSLALRTKKDSSMRVAINLVQDGTAQACVSAGNTGALMATARFVLKTLPGINRPAIITTMPTQSGHTRMLDLGANVDCSAEVLFQFAVMGAVLTEAVDHSSRPPSVGLLNIGEEEIKGNEQVKDAARLLADSELNYVGYVEGDDIYNGEVDVIVCDGFVGNVALKTSEGLAKMIGYFIKAGFNENLLTKLAGVIAAPVLRRLKHRIDPRRYNGASLVGLQGIVVKSHGGADAFAFANAIKEAIAEVNNNVPERITRQLEYLLIKRRAV